MVFAIFAFISNGELENILLINLNLTDWSTPWNNDPCCTDTHTTYINKKSQHYFICYLGLIWIKQLKKIKLHHRPKFDFYMLFYLDTYFNASIIFFII
jgi:hypothetical protein